MPIPFQTFFYPTLSLNPKTSQGHLCPFSLLSSFKTASRLILSGYQSLLPLASYCFALSPDSFWLLPAPLPVSPPPTLSSGLSETTSTLARTHPLCIVKLISECSDPSPPLAGPAFPRTCFPLFALVGGEGSSSHTPYIHKQSVVAFSLPFSTHNFFTYLPYPIVSIFCVSSSWPHDHSHK